MMLATLGWMRDEVEAMQEGGKTGRVVLVRAAAELGNWGGAGVIPSISPTCSRAIVELSSVHSPAAGTVDWRACLRIVLVGGAGWP
jgi:hypothetical protein